MNFHESHSWAASVDEVFKARCQQSVRESACKDSGALSWDVRVDAAEATTTVTIERVMPPDVPPAMRAFIGDTISVHQHEVWAPRGSGGYRAEVTVTIKGQPATMVGTSIISADDASGSLEVTEGEVKVAIPIFGRKVEPEIARVVSAALVLEQEAAEKWLAGRSR